MNRRQLLQIGAATVVAGSFTGKVWAQSAAPVSPANPYTPAFPSPAVANRKITLDAYSRTLHWLREPEEVAKAILEIGNKSVDLTVRSGTGHVNPEKVKTELPAFVNGLRRNGVEVTMIAPTITEADSPNSEAVLDAASSLGIHYYWWGTFRFDESKPYWPQLDALKSNVEKLARLNEKYGMKAMAHPRSGSGSVSGGFYDLLYILKEFDPRWVSYQYDTGQLLQASQSTVVMQLRMGAPYIGGFVWKDSVLELASSPNPDDAFRAARGTAPRGGMTPNPAEAPGAGGAGAVAGAVGRGPGGNPNAEPSRWRTRQVPVGTGLINLKLIAQTLKEINFNGPMECEPEWPQLGGADQGADKITISREECLRLLRRDRETVEAAMRSAGLIS